MECGGEETAVAAGGIAAFVVEGAGGRCFGVVYLFYCGNVSVESSQGNARQDKTRQGDRDRGQREKEWKMGDKRTHHEDVSLVHHRSPQHSC